MNSRKPLIAANWKMNPRPVGALEAQSPYLPQSSIDVVVFANILDVNNCVTAGLVTGAQCARSEDYGAYTGDINMQMIKDSGCTHVLCGHSERRKYHNETNAEVANQAKAAIALGLIPVICVGETEQQRNDGLAESTIYTQLQEFPLEEGTIIAYEPVWAIGTGNTASPEQAEHMHAFIRSTLPVGTQETTRILYGGSMKPANAAELLAQPNIDGGLIGGAALDPAAFAEITAIAERNAH